MKHYYVSRFCLLVPSLGAFAQIGTLDGCFSSDGLLSADGVGSSYD